ncbi:MAG: CGNR zinc finger domain-containing protein [Alphaproteobacteria bacterium]|nr:CGNR zinc finger domain-containing protein [Alphaproteobacteria bacterium]MCW5741646.1 CGNR zinc finger domain-containing protein [Alphaproteobacteria bacterium]
MTPQPSYRQVPPRLVGGARAVDFANTVEWRGDPAARGERLTSYDEFLIWAQAAGLIDAAAHRRLLSDAARQPAAARKVLRDAIALREALAAVLAGGGRAALATLNEALSATRFSYRVEPAEGGLRAVAAGDVDALRAPLAQLVHDIVEFLASKQLARVGHCADHRCGWFFVDTSRNGSRLWCDMAACGNKAKARAFYGRRRRSHNTESIDRKI